MTIVAERQVIFELFILAVIRRRLTTVLLECAVEIGNVVEACLIGNFNDWLVSGAQHSHRLCHPIFYDIINARHAGDTPEQP